MEAIEDLVVMDPWKLNSDALNSSDLNMSFEDNFIDSVGSVGLPDSAEYIASLGKFLLTFPCCIFFPITFLYVYI